MLEKKTVKRSIIMKQFLIIYQIVATNMKETSTFLVEVNEVDVHQWNTKKNSFFYQNVFVAYLVPFLKIS